MQDISITKQEYNTVYRDIEVPVVITLIFIITIFVPVVGPTQPSVQRVTGLFPGVKAAGAWD